MTGPTISLQQTASRLRMKEGATRGLVTSGRLRGYQAPNGRWRVLLEDVERLERQLAMERAVAVGEPTELARVLGDAYPIVTRMHVAGRSMALLQAQFDMDLQALEADAAEAEQQGDAKRAADLREMAAGMRQATYGVDHATGKVVVGLRQEDGSVLVAKSEQPA